MGRTGVRLCAFATGLALLAAGCSSGEGNDDGLQAGLPPVGLPTAGECSWERTVGDVGAVVAAVGNVWTYLEDAAMASPTDVWAVGGQVTAATLPDFSADGLRSEVAPERVERGGGIARAVDRAGVRFSGQVDAGEPEPALAMHYDGIVWSGVDVDAVGQLKAVSVSDGTVWAVGSDGSGTLVVTGDGAGLDPVELGRGAETTAGFLEGVIAFGEGDVWAVGFESAPVSNGDSDPGSADDDEDPPAVGDTDPESDPPEGGAGGGPSGDDSTDEGETPDEDLGPGTEEGDRIVIEHFDGEMWKRGGFEEPGLGHDRLLAIDGSAPDDLWAVGTSQDDAGVSRPLALHFDGEAWSQAEVPMPDDAVMVELLDVAVDATDAAFAAGRAWRLDENEELSQHTFAVRWDGVSWGIEPTPDPGVIRDRGGFVPPLGPGVDAVTTGEAGTWMFGEQITEPDAEAYVLSRSLALGQTEGEWVEHELPTAIAAEGDGPTDEILLGADSDGGEIWTVGLFADADGIRPTAIRGTCQPSSSP